MKNEIEIDGITYVQKEAFAKNAEGQLYVIVRGDRSGVFAGYLKKREGREVTLNNCRRLWYWSGAASISQIAECGVSNPKGCKFAVPVAEILILDAIEVLTAKDGVEKNINGVAIWKA